MSAGQATLAVAPTQLVPLQRVVLSLPITTDARRVAHNQLVVAIDRALEARRALSKSAIDPFRLTTLFLVAATTLAAMGCVQADRLRRAATAMALLATGMAIALTPLVAQAAPFAGYFAISADLPFRCARHRDGWVPSPVDLDGRPRRSYGGCAEKEALMTILPGAGAYWFEGNDIGCLLVHGFTGTPQNVRPLADYLARRGLAVSAPRMPGHGTVAADLDATGPQDWLGAAEDALAELRRRCSTVFVAGISMGGTITLELARRHPDLAGIVVMAAPVLALEGLEPLVKDPNRPFSVPAPWSTVGVLTEDVGVGGIAYLEMPLGALERGMGLMDDVRAGLADVRVPSLLIYGDADLIVDRANGPFVLDAIASSDKRLLALPDSSHEVTLDVDRERVMVEVFDFIRARSKE